MNVYIYQFIDDNPIADEDLALWQEQLDDGDLAYAEKLTSPSRKRQFILGRKILKTALKEHNLKTSVSTKNGRPFVEKGSCSISHSGSRIVAALSLSSASIGIDIEQRKHRSFKQIANECFSPRNILHVGEAINFNNREEEVFYGYWTLKEAHAKLCGTGFSGVMQRIGFKPLHVNIDTAQYLLHHGDDYSLALASETAVLPNVFNVGLNNTENELPLTQLAINKHADKTPWLAYQLE